MKINKKNLSEFNGTFVSFTYIPPSINNEIYFHHHDHILINSEVTTRKKELIVVFDNDKKIDEFMKEIYSPCTIIVDDEYCYGCILLSTPTTRHLGAGHYQITFELSVIKKGVERIIKLENTKNHVNVQGNTECGVIYEVTPLSNIDSITIAGIQVSNLYIDKKLTIDGINKKVYSSSETNKYGDCIFPKNMFPTLIPGLQIINISTMNVKATLRYCPIFM